MLTINILKQKINYISNYPKKGVIFRDLGPLYLDGYCYKSLIKHLSQRIVLDIGDFDCIAAMEAQGFIIGGALAQRLHKGFIQIRKEGELPGLTRRTSFSMQYANCTMEIQSGIIKPKSRILVFDDAIATGKTALAAKQLIEDEGGVVTGFAFIMELGGFEGRKMLSGSNIVSLMYFPPNEDN